MTSDQPTRKASRLPLVVMASVVAALVLLTIAIVAASSPKNFDPGTPEAALQGFLNAVFEEDEDTALEWMTPRAAEACRRDFETNNRRWFSEGMRAQIDEVDIDQDRAVIEILLRGSDLDDPFDNSSWSTGHRYVLLRIDGNWLVDFASWPWPIRQCAEVET